MSWSRIKCSLDELRLDVVLVCGQSFRWRQVDTGEYRSVLAGHVISLKQDQSYLYYQIHNSGGGNESETSENITTKRTSESVSKITTSSKSTRKCKSNLTNACEHSNIQALIVDYFQLNISTRALYDRWEKDDKNFKNLKSFTGIHVLRQDPVENLFSFICSSNNNIKRISSMVECLATNFGEYLMSIDDVDYYTFPNVESLVQDGVEEKLRKLKFGYRAKFIVKTAEYICAQRPGWLMSLRSLGYDEAKSELLKLYGVGEKVADCVLLMSLDKPGSVPIDTHIASVARQTYITNLPVTKSITTTLYKRIADYFRTLWGEYAGWAQAVVFSADLPQFNSDKNMESKAKKRKHMAE